MFISIYRKYLHYFERPCSHGMAKKTWRHERIILCICDQQVSFGQIMFSPPTKIFPIRRCCWGQNKNNYVIWYYCWRILCGLHNSILYSFLIAGHTKYSPDWCFGLVKQSFRRRNVSSLFDLMEAVDKSTVSGDNVAKLCGLHDGTVLVPVYDSGQLGLILIREL